MERFSHHFLLELSAEERAIVENNDLGFETPVNFVEQAKNKPKEGTLGTMLVEAPRLIYEFIERELPRTQRTYSPVNTFYHVKVGTIPPWLVNWAMDIQRPTRVANSTLFFRAVHLLEQFRCYVHNVTMPDVVVDQDVAGDEPPAMPLEVVLSEGEQEQLLAVEDEEDEELELVEVEPVQLEEEAEPERWNREEKGKGPGKGKRSRE